MFASKDLFFSKPSGYQISRSVRFRSSATAYFQRTPASAGNQKTWTWSGWVKRGKLGSAYCLFGGGLSNLNYFELYFTSDNLYLYDVVSTAQLVTSSVYRDPSAWYHVVATVDTTQATSSNRIKLYVNGVQVTTFSTSVYPAQNANLYINSANVQTIGALNFTSSITDYFDGYLTEVNFIDGQALTPSSFGQTNTVTGVWQPIKYTGTYGTNGFYLNFSDNSAATATTIGKDYSGNGNNWTPNNISVTAGATYDSMLDVPTPYADGGNGRGNYPVFSPLWTGSPTITNGNLQLTSATASQTAIASMANTVGGSGKFYFEYQYTSAPSTNGGGGVWDTNSTFSAGGVPDSGTGTRYIPTNGNIYKYVNSSATLIGTYATYGSGDVIGVAFDCGAGTVSYYKNNVLQVTITDATNLVGKALAPCVYIYAGNVAANFGQRPFTYTPPTGFVALNTQNLPTPTISNGANYMAATLYTGTGATQTISNAVNGVSFQPDLVWVKNRSNVADHALQDTVRGITNVLRSSSTVAEFSGGVDYVTAVTSSGFTEGTSQSVNASTQTYVAWQWQAGKGSTSSNTNGSITSTVSVGATQGFSVVTYTGNGTGTPTIGHGLGVAPAMIIAKTRSTANGWLVYHQSLGATKSIILNGTNAATTQTDWGNTTPTSTVFYVNGGNNNISAATYVAYCFSEVAGYSKFGSYTGNGSADGPFVFTNFQPRWIMVKRTDSTSDWLMYDTSRNTYNEANLYLGANVSTAESTGVPFDILSNGFKCRNTTFNVSSGTYIFAAFASSPFKLSLAK